MQKQVEMMDFKAQYAARQPELEAAVATVLASGRYINGPEVGLFAQNLADYLQVPFVISCANGTDALQIALMALGLQPGDEVIVPAFTYVATAEVVGLLGLVPVLVDVDPRTFNIDVEALEQAYSPKTKAIVPVHLFGLCADMAPILAWARSKGVYVVEDVAQALGARYLPEGLFAGTIGDIGCTSFFPTKPLGCFGDGGALFTHNAELAARIKMIANHGQREKYRHEILGCNSRLDTLQAAILNVKLKYIDEDAAARRCWAQAYREALEGLSGLLLPQEAAYSTHVYHQFTLRILNGKRDAVQAALAARGMASVVYYPLALHQQEAFKELGRIPSPLKVSEQLCQEVLSLPMNPAVDFSKLRDWVKNAL